MTEACFRDMDNSGHIINTRIKITALPLITEDAFTISSNKKKQMV